MREDLTRFGVEETRTPEDVDRTVAVKVEGAANLMSLTEQDLVRCFVGFSSVAGRFGAKGQSDYGVANEMLAKQIDWYRSTHPAEVFSTC